MTRSSGIAERDMWYDRIRELEDVGFLTAVEAGFARERITAAYSSHGPRPPFPARVHMPECRFPDETCVCP